MASQVFHGLFFSGMDSETAKDLKTRMFPGYIIKAGMVFLI